VSLTAPLPTEAAPALTTAARDHLLRRVVRKPVAALSIGFILLMIVCAIFAPLIAPYGPYAQNLFHILAKPSASHLLGTDELGRDVLSRILYGGRDSLTGVAIAVAVALGVGVPLGLLAGYLGGTVDTIIARLADIVLSIPVMIILLVVLSIFSDNEPAAMVTLGFLGAPVMIRVVRGATLAVRNELYIKAAMVSGLTAPQIMRRHVLSRVSGPVVVNASLFAGGALLAQTGLAFLGLGVQEPTPSWGSMVGEGQQVITQDPWLIVPSGAVIGLTVLAFGLIGDAVRDAMGERRSALGPARSLREVSKLIAVMRLKSSPRLSAIEVPAEASEGSARTGLLQTGLTPDSELAPVTTPVAGNALLSLQGISVAFPTPNGSEIVVKDVSFDVAEGETVGLVGETGCGKSVTARAILGLLGGGGRITSGHCFFQGVDLVGFSQRRYREIRGSKIALISQEPTASLDPNYQVGAQIAQVLRLHEHLSHKAAKARVIELLRRVKMPDPERVAKRYPHELSGGMAQRVCIAAALAGQPRLLIADEPTTALDVTIQAEILDLLRELQQDTGMSILLITHDWGVVADLCQRAVAMYAGEVVEATGVADIFAQPLHPYTAALLASDPHGAAIGERLPTIPGTVPSPGQWPKGCHFSSRCPFATEECSHGPIDLLERAPGRLTRCIHHEALLAGAGQP
jgi:peptide/nickel transport system permease protein